MIGGLAMIAYNIQDNITFHAKQGLEMKSIKSRLITALGAATFILLFFIAQFIYISI
jgi:hypothetical protein